MSNARYNYSAVFEIEDYTSASSLYENLVQLLGNAAHIALIVPQAQIEVLSDDYDAMIAASNIAGQHGATVVRSRIHVPVEQLGVLANLRPRPNHF